MNWRKLSLYSYIAMLLLLLGCPSTPVCITAIDTRANYFTLSFTESTERQYCHSDGNIISVKFTRQADDQVLWLVEFKRQADKLPTLAEGGSPRENLFEGYQLDRITYGIVPEGFYVPEFIGTATPLKSGETIEIFVQGTVGIGYLELTLE